MRLEESGWMPKTKSQPPFELTVDAERLLQNMQAEQKTAKEMIKQARAIQKKAREMRGSLHQKDV